MQVKEIHKRFTIVRTVPGGCIYGPFDLKQIEINGSGQFVEYMRIPISMN